MLPIGVVAWLVVQSPVVWVPLLVFVSMVAGVLVGWPVLAAWSATRVFRRAERSKKVTRACFWRSR